MEYVVQSMEGKIQNKDSQLCHTPYAIHDTSSLARHTPYAIRYTSSRGITLVEIIVSVGLFAIVMFVLVGALLSLTGANRKAQALQSVMNNLNIALDGMVRSIRMGSDYNGSVDCAGNTGGNPLDCTGGTTTFSFEVFDGDPAITSDQWVYAYDPANERIKKSENNGLSYVPLTSPEVKIERMRFYVVGTNRGDALQPKVVISVGGTAGGANFKTKTTFNIQATAVQRLLDI